MAWKVGILGTGSSANAYVVHDEGRSLMIDNGFSLRETLSRMRRLGLSPTDLGAILLTHDHHDHTRGVFSLMKQFSLPVYAPRGMSLLSANAPEEVPLRPIPLFEEISLDAFSIFGFNTFHDTPSISAGFSIKSRHGVVTLITDTGEVDDTMLHLARSSNVLVLEANYSPEMLWSGPYPPFLKERVNHYHLSNVQAGRFLAKLARTSNRLQEIVLVHLSDKNNSPQTVLREVVAELSGGPWSGIQAHIVGAQTEVRVPSGRLRLWILPKKAGWIYASEAARVQA